MRLEGQIKAGYFPAPEQAIDLIADHLVPSARRAILDPCAGEGRALKQLADRLGVPPDSRFAIELDRARGQQCRKTLGDESHVLSPASAMGVQVPRRSFPLIYCNAPFDHERGGGSRTEGDFLEAVTRWLMPGGVLVFICPESVAKTNYIYQLIATWYDNVLVFPFPDDCRKYDEVVLLAVRRKEMIAP